MPKATTVAVRGKAYVSILLNGRANRQEEAY